MSINLLEVQFSSQYASLKLVNEGTGILTAPTTSTSVQVTATIPHNAGTSQVILQVGGSLYDNVIPGVLEPGIITPWSTGDGRVNCSAQADANNLYLVLTLSTGVSPQDSITWTYYYRVIVP